MEVWIEISLRLSTCRKQSRHFPCGSVDWNSCWPRLLIRQTSHFPCGSVDWNWEYSPYEIHDLSHFPCGSVDWNRIQGRLFHWQRGHFPCGSVDWNGGRWQETICLFWSLPLWKCGLKLRYFETQRRPGTSHFPCGSVDWNLVNIQFPQKEMSLPLWKCGLKLCRNPGTYIFRQSLPLWKCGLKYLQWI